MILPIRTSILPRRTPYANYALIVANVVVFLLTYAPAINPYTREIVRVLRPWAEQFQLVPNQLHIWQLVSYAFLHGSFLHIIGNMFFLYLFGNNVNDELGSVGYLAFYLGGAIFSGIGHTLLHLSSPMPTLGASGAVAAVTGAYLVLFPRTLITILYWFIFIGTMEVPALYFIAFKLIFIDNVLARYTPHVAYDAHLAGYAFGILALLVLLAKGFVSSSSYDLLAMIKQWNRRRQYRDAVAGGYDPFTGRTTKWVRAKEIKKTESQLQNEERIKQLRSDIASRMSQRNLPAAAEAYLELMGVDGGQVLSRQYLLDIANQLAGEKRHAESARAYEQFLAHYGNYEYAEQVQLMLGLIYCRYLNKPEVGAKHLRIASEKLSDPGQLKMCRDELDRLQG